MGEQNILYETKFISIRKEGREKGREEERRKEGK